MTTLTEAAMRQALEALDDLLAEQNGPPLIQRESAWNAACANATGAIKSLRTALAQSNIPAGYELWGGPKNGAPISFYGFERTLQRVEEKKVLHESWEWKVVPVYYNPLAPTVLAQSAEPVATLHDDGCFTWKLDEFRLKYDRQRAGWRMDVYAHPPAQRDERAAFEAWAVRDYWAIHRNGGEQYVNTATEHAWRGWKARAALERKP